MNLSVTTSATSASFYNFTYNDRGQRLSKRLTGGQSCSGGSCYNYTVSGSTPNQFIYDQQGHLIGEYEYYAGTLVEYIWLGDTPVAVLKPDPASAANPPQIYFVHADHLEAPRVLLDRANNIRWTRLAEPFGTTPANDNPVGLGAFSFNLRQPGQYWDAESGLHYNMARYYDPGIGRYTQSDPIGLAGGINTYSYADGSPTSKTDPLGLATYQCTRKLNNFPFRVGPLYHQFVCTGNAKDGYSCQGLGPTGSMFDSPGKLEPDVYKPEVCDKVDDDNQCIEACIARRFTSSVPNYSADLSHGDNCQTYARSVVGECEASCHVRRK